MDIDLQRQLLPGEQVVWEGHPPTGLLLRSEDVVAIPLSALWCGFVIYWNVAVWIENGSLFFKLVGAAGLVLGLQFVVGRFWTDRRIRRRTRYVVTDRRVLFLKGRGSPAKSFDIRRLPALEVDARTDGSGTIRFGSSGSMFSGPNSGFWPGASDATPQFFRIPNVRAVYELIQRNAE
jgi:hypothetical protein